jgi:hypothetical protein
MALVAFFCFLVFLNDKAFALKQKHLRYRRRVAERHPLCPASTNPYHYEAGLLSYPADIFSSKTLERNSQAYNCTSYHGT